MIDLSIIITSYNTKKLTLQCIESVANEGSDLDKEIIVVDNRSTDGSVDAIRNFQLPTSLPRRQAGNFQLKVIENDKNLGFAKANNQGIDIANGKYILLLNSDTVVKNNSLSKLVSFAKKAKDAGVVGARLLNPDGTVQPSCFNFPTIGRAIQQHWLRKGKPLDKFVPDVTRPGPVTVDAVVGAAFLITPKALKEAGLLDGRYFFFYEDLDYCRRVWDSGLKVYYHPEAEIVHLHGASGKGTKEKKDQWRRLIPSSKIYHGTLKHYIFNFILWTGQKFLGSE